MCVTRQGNPQTSIDSPVCKERREGEYGGT